MTLEGYRQRVFQERAKLKAAFADAEGHQRRVLEDLLEFNAGTEFGRAHGFSGIRTLDDFRKAVPINTYADLKPWIERAAAGERNLLSADDPAVYFTSSGSTGAHKKIPVTPRFMRTTFFPFYYAAWAPLIEHFPEVLARPDAVLNLKHDPLSAPPTTASGRPHVGASQVDFGALFGEPLSAEPGTSAPWATLPVELAADAHLEKMYQRLRMAVCADVRCVIGINPAMVAAVPYQLNLWWERILRDVHETDPIRAGQLERLSGHFGRIRPAHVWPNLRAIFCWTTGLASLYLPRLREEFGAGVTVLPAPVAASEGPTAVALDRHATAGSLVMTAAAYEFVDAAEDLKPDSETVGPQALEPGRWYHTIFSHVGGLYRYVVGDVVRVVDRVDGVARLEYAGRSLAEARLIAALHTACRATGLEVVNATCRLETGYTLEVAPRGRWSAQQATGLEVVNATCRLETGHTLEIAPRGRWSPREVERFETVLTDALGRKATVQCVDPEAFLREWHATVATGVRPTQVKDRMFKKGSPA